jgi:hypothetical protein
MIQFELMEHVELAGFDARRVVGDLITHKELWESALMMPDPAWALLHLRDLGENKWNVDCLYIFSAGQDNIALTELAQTWMPTELMWLDDEYQKEMMRVPDRLMRRVLRLFW